MILTRVPLPLVLLGRQRQRVFLLSRMRTSGPPVVRSMGSATLPLLVFSPDLATAVAVFLAMSIRHTVLLAVSST